jgi:hypothetical protein
MNMSLLAGDIRFAQSVNMADVPEGGGPPSAHLLESGRSNEVLQDISEETRTTGRVEIAQIHSVLLNGDTAALLGANAIIAEPPADPNGSITILSLGDPFASRADVARRIESGMVAGSEWSGYLLENHFATMRSVQLLQRPDTPPPAIGKTYLLVYQEGKPSERRQRIRIRSADTVVRMFTQVISGQLVDFQAQVTTCELFDPLLFDFPGSAPARTFARDAAQTLVRETVYSDSGLFYSASRLSAPTTANDNWLKVDNIYTQVVPNSRSEVASVDQNPAARRIVVLADMPRRVEIGITPHTQRFKIDDVNVGLVYVFQCQPLPEPGTLFIDYWALGQRYTLADDGAGQLTGSGGGAVSYLTGSVSITLKAVPDIGSAICLTHGSRLAYTNRATQGAAVRAPEYAWVIEGDTDKDSIMPGTLVIAYTSAGIVYTLADNGRGRIMGDGGEGFIDYHSRHVILHPSHMPDPGAEFLIDCALDELMMEQFPRPSLNAPDAGGFIHFSLQTPPMPGTLQVEFAVTRTVSQTSGATLTPTTASKDDSGDYYQTMILRPADSVPPSVNGLGVRFSAVTLF